MKLSIQDSANLSSILSTAMLGKIDMIVIEDGFARGMNIDRTYILISDHNIPKIPQKMGLSRLGELKQRLDLFNGSAIIDAKESERGEISSLEVSSGKNKLQFRCTSTAIIKAPKGVNDEPFCKVFMTRDEKKVLLNAMKVMGCTTLQIVIKKDRTATFTFSDSTNDPFTSLLENPIELTGAEQDSVVFYHHADIFHAAMRSGPDIDITTLEMGVSGTIRYEINGHAVVVMPKINEDQEEE
jgi:hypothetical protein